MTRQVIDDVIYEVNENPSKVEQLIYDWVAENFGESEAEEPSWNIELLSEWINENLNNPEYQPEYSVRYSTGKAIGETT